MNLLDLYLGLIKLPEESVILNFMRAGCATSEGCFLSYYIVSNYLHGGRYF
jgi:hypothetical protein